MKTSADENTGTIPVRKDGQTHPKHRVVWVGLLSLLVGVALLDRSFAWWRNNPLSFPYANGVYPTAAEIDPALRGQVFHPSALRPMAVFGAFFLVLSVVLLGRERDSSQDQ